jgi:hypothetical protein
MEDTGRLIAVVLLASFAIERAAAAVDFFMAAATEKRRKLVRVGISVLIAFGVVAFTGIRILGAMKFHSPSAWIDFLLTWLILVGGADKIDRFLGAGAKPATAAMTPISGNSAIRPIQIFVDNEDVTKQAVRRTS